MTIENMFGLVESGQIPYAAHAKQESNHYCVSAALDCLLERKKVSKGLYKENREGMMQPDETLRQEKAEMFFDTIARQIFEVEDVSVVPKPYYFGSLEEFATDLAELRGRSSVLLDFSSGEHSAGLKPFGEDPDRWQLVGTELIGFSVSSDETHIKYHRREPPVLTTEQVWQKLIESSPIAENQTAKVFPPEPDN